MSLFCESLESRTLMSAAPVKATVESPVITADRAAISADLASISTTVLSCKIILKSRRDSITAARSADQATIRGAIQRVKADRNDPTQLALDKQSLEVSRDRLKTDLVTLKANLTRDTKNCQGTMATERLQLKQHRRQLALDLRAGK